MKNLQRLTLSLLPPIFAAVLLCGPAAGQDGRLLRPGRDSLSFFLISGTDTSVAGWGLVQLSTCTHDGVLALCRVYEVHDKLLGSWTDSSRDRLDGIRPLTHVQHGRNSLAVTFSAEGASGWVRTYRGDSATLAIPLPKNAISATSFDLLIRASPLSSTWTLEVPGLVAEIPSVVVLQAHVVAEEVIAGVATWRVEAVSAGAPVTFWVAKTDRRMVQQRMQRMPGEFILIRSTAKRPAWTWGRAGSLR